MKEQWIMLIDLFEEGDDEKNEEVWFKLTSAEQKEFIELLQNKFADCKYDSMYKYYMDLYKQTKLNWEEIIMN